MIQIKNDFSKYDGKLVRTNDCIENWLLFVWRKLPGLANERIKPDVTFLIVDLGHNEYDEMAIILDSNGIGFIQRANLFRKDYNDENLFTIIK